MSTSINDARTLGNELKNNLGGVARDLKDSVMQGREYISSAAGDAADIGKHAVSSAVSTAGERVKHATDAISEKAHQAADAAGVARDKVSAFIEERPFTSVLIAFGIGAIVSRLINHSKS